VELIRISPFAGFRLSLRLWKLVAALWLFQLLLITPVMLIVENALAPSLAALPEGAMADGDLALIVIQAFDEIRAPAILMLLVAVVLGWLWTVMWHGGVVSWRLWADTDKAQLSRILGLGLVSFWKFLRLSLVSNALVFTLLILAWWPLGKLISSSYTSMQEARMMQAIGFGLVVTVLVIWVCRAAVLRASWILGRHDRRSAVLALFDGIVGAFAHPLSSLGTVALFSVLAFGAGAAPLIAGMMNQALRSGIPAQVFSHVAALVAAFFWLALFTSFAPASGLFEHDE